MTIHFDEDKQKQRLSDLLHKEEEDIVNMLSAKYGIDYVNLLGTGINTDALRLVDEKLAREIKVAPYALLDKKVRIAVRNPEDPKLKPFLEDLEKKGYKPELHIASTQSLEKAWKGYKDLSFTYESRAGSLEISPPGSPQPMRAGSFTAI